MDLPRSLCAAALKLGLELSPREADSLLDYLALLQRWNARYNLTSVRDAEQMLRVHLLDCLAIIRPLRRHIAPSTDVRLLDAGSGGGLPGIVIAVLNPRLLVTCVDAVGKKAAFVQQVKAELQLNNLTAVHGRVEAIEAPAFDVITSRAFASLADFASLTRPRLAKRGVWMAMKGKRPDDELAALSRDISVFHVEPLAVPTLDAERCLIWMRPVDSSSP